MEQRHCRKGRSTAQAVQALVEIRNRANKGTHRTREICLMASLDVKNAFNVVRYRDIIKAMEEMAVPLYLVALTGSYLTDRKIMVEKPEGRIYEFIPGAGVPQGSVLGPTLWTIVYNGVLKVPVPHGVTIVGFADDLTVAVEDRSLESAMHKLRKAIRIIEKWLEERTLQLVPEKTRVALLTGRRGIGAVTLEVLGQKITTARAIKILGITIDKNGTYIEHVREMTNRALGMCQ